MLVAIINFLQAWRRYNTSLRELYQLGDRELADIGISRSDIPRWLGHRQPLIAVELRRKAPAGGRFFCVRGWNSAKGGSSSCPAGRHWCRTHSRTLGLAGLQQVPPARAARIADCRAVCRSLVSRHEPGESAQSTSSAAVSRAEAAWQIAQRGVPVVLHEMRPLRTTAAHKTRRLPNSSAPTRSAPTTTSTMRSASCTRRCAGSAR